MKAAKMKAAFLIWSVACAVAIDGAQDVDGSSEEVCKIARFFYQNRGNFTK
jgi:hypothetical protein